MTESKEKEVAMIPFFVHESTVDRLERINKRWFISFLIVLGMLFVSNLAWVIYENSFQDEVYTYEIQQDSGQGGTNTYTGNTVRIVGGDLNGEANGENYSQAPGTQENERTDTENLP